MVNKSHPLFIHVLKRLFEGPDPVPVPIIEAVRHTLARSKNTASLDALRMAVANEEQELARSQVRRLQIESLFQKAATRIENPIFPKPPDRGLVELSEFGEGLPTFGGVYFIFNGEVVEYVGQSSNISGRVRLKSSHYKLLKGDRVSWIEFDEPERIYAESYYIGLLMPTRNGQWFRPGYKSQAINYRIQTSLF